MGKVIHVSDELHARLRDYCEKEGVPMSIWASDVLTMALDNGTVIENWRKVDAAPVERKKLPRMEAQNGDDPWQSEPFWERKGKEPEKQLEEDGPRAPKRVGGEGEACAEGAAGFRVGTRCLIRYDMELEDSSRGGPTLGVGLTLDRPLMNMLMVVVGMRWCWRVTLP